MSRAKFVPRTLARANHVFFVTSVLPGPAAHRRPARMSWCVRFSLSLALVLALSHSLCAAACALGLSCARAVLRRFCERFRGSPHVRRRDVSMDSCAARCYASVSSLSCAFPPSLARSLALFAFSSASVLHVFHVFHALSLREIDSDHAFFRPCFPIFFRKGFKKAMVRLPQQLMSKAGYAEGAVHCARA